MLRNMNTKYIVVSGGVLSGLGKGTATASIARLLNKSFKKVVIIKCDGYLNVDPGTMNPIEHGEVFVLDDGGEVDMDFGHYERFLNINEKFKWNITSGKVFLRLIERERKGDFLGKTIQIIPHVPMQILEMIDEIREEENADLIMIEIGGTVGDIENSWFIEAVRRLKKQYPSDVFFIHLTYIPFLDNVSELKTKPAQRDIALLRSKGINPDIVIARSKYLLPEKIKEKLSVMCDIDKEQIIAGIDIDSVYEIPLVFEEQGILSILSKLLHINIEPDLERWRELVERLKNPKRYIKVAIAGKYTYLKDSYASVIEALNHAGAHLSTGIKVKWIETTLIEEGKININEALKDVDAIIVPGGFGVRGTEGKIKVIEYARKNKVPFLGLCLGLQLAVIEFARHRCHLKDANSTEFDKSTKHNVIDLLDEQRNITQMGGTMRLGSYPAVIKEGTIVYDYYKKLGLLSDNNIAYERHRHRYEVNPSYHEILQKHGLVFSGLSPDNKLVEFIELSKDEHPYFVATQAHPELKSRFECPAPLFYGLIESALSIKQTKKG